MDAFVEEFSGEKEGSSLEEDLLEASWGRYHAEIAAVQRDIHHVRSETARRLAQWGMRELERDPGSCWAVEGWLRQQARALEMNLHAMFLRAMRECALERAARAQAIRKFCDERGREGSLERSPQFPPRTEE